MATESDPDPSEQNRLLAEIQDGSELLSSVLNTMLDGFIAINQDGIILEMNPAAERIIHCSRTAVLGKSLVDLIIPPSVHQLYARRVREHIEYGDTRYLNRYMEISALHADDQ